MVRFNRILVPMDEDDLSDRALDFAIELAHHFESELVVLTVRPDNVDLDQKKAPGELDDVEYEFRALERRAQERIAKSDRIPMSRVQVQVRAGNVVSAIVEATDDSLCDLVVMATHGRQGLGEHLIGSMTERVQSQVTASVLAVKF